jgi:hypothetical protein
MSKQKPQKNTQKNGLTAKQLSNRKKDAIAMARLLYDIHKRRVADVKIELNDNNEQGGKGS